MKRGSKLLLGILSFMPLVLLVLYISLIVPRITGLVATQQLQPPQESASYFFSYFSSLFILLVLSVIINIVLIIYYTLHLVNKTKAGKNEKIVWIILFVFASIVAFPIYFFARILPKHK